MSKHDESNILNEVLLLLEDYNFFKQIGSKKTHDFVKSIVEIGDNYDCNNAEILDEIGERIGICYCCLESAQDFVNGICKKCNNENR